MISTSKEDRFAPSVVTASNLLLILLGSASWLAYLAALGLGDLRTNTPGFEIAFGAAFILYLAACALSLTQPSQPASRTGGGNPWVTHDRLLITFVFAVLFRLTLLPSRPTLSDDMYRYVWDGRVQAAGLSPYRYPPQANEVSALRETDTTIWPSVNRKDAVTIYPPGAQLAYAIVWRAVGDSLVGFKAVFVVAELLGGVLLIRLLKHFGLPLERVLIYLWSPLLVFEVAHAGHVDGLMMPFLVAAFWARADARPGLLGLFLAAAALVKLFPALLLPALLPVPPHPAGGRLNDYRPAARTLAVFVLVLAAAYGPYLLGGASPAGYLPRYFNENFNLGLARFLFDAAARLHLSGSFAASTVSLGGVAILALAFLLRPAQSASQALARCIWLIGWFALFTQNLPSWYLLWMLPLIVLFIAPGRILGFNLAPATAWLIFSGTIMLSYLFFIRWRVVAWGQVAEYVPLYTWLLLSGLQRAWPALRLRLHPGPALPAEK